MAGRGAVPESTTAIRLTVTVALICDVRTDPLRRTAAGGRGRVG